MHIPSSNITLSPKILTSTAPRVLSTMRVKISRIDFDRAFTSMAQTPKTIGFTAGAAIVDKLESEPDGDGDIDLLVTAELDLAERR